MPRLRSLLFNGLFYVWTGILSVLALPLTALPSRYLLGMIHFWTRSVVELLRLVVGLRYQVRGMEHFPAGPVIVACKHQSAWETLALWCLLRHPSYVLKRELTMIPVWGWMIPKAGMIPVDRSGGPSALRRMVADGERIVSLGRPIVIFPEGTRVFPGQTGKFHPGVAALYSGLNIPVVPVALNSGLFWPRRQPQRSGLITVEFLPPIPPDLPRRDFMARLHEAIEAATLRLEAEAANSGDGLTRTDARQAALR